MKIYKSSTPLYCLKESGVEYKKVKITCAKDSHVQALKYYEDDIGIFESAFIMLLNNANNTIGQAKISQGGIAGTMIDIRLIAKYAVETMAKSVIIIHNHPTGKLEPSRADNELTTKIKTGLKTLNIELLDHLIISKLGFYSYAENGKL